VVTPQQKRAAVRVMQEHKISIRKACETIDIKRSTFYYESKMMQKDQPMMQKIKSLSEAYPRFGYRRITVMLKNRYHIDVNPKRVYRLWKMMHLQLPKKRPKRRRVGNDPVKLASVRKNHIWSYDFLSDRCANGQKLKILAVIDEYTRECLALEVAGSIRSNHLIDTLSRLMTIYGKPQFIRSDNGPEFTSKAVISWLSQNNIETAFIKPGSPWQNGFVESFNGKFRDECLSREWFLDRRDAKVLIEKWRHFYNHERPHSGLSNKTPAEVSDSSYAA
jgi:transposase InsO family protein